MNVERHEHLRLVPDEIGSTSDDVDLDSFEFTEQMEKVDEAKDLVSEALKKHDKDGLYLALARLSATFLGHPDSSFMSRSSEIQEQIEDFFNRVSIQRKNDNDKKRRVSMIINLANNKIPIELTEKWGVGSMIKLKTDKPQIGEDDEKMADTLWMIGLNGQNLTKSVIDAFAGEQIYSE